MMDVVLGVDVGGTKLLGGLTAVDGSVLADRERPTPLVDGRCDPGFVAVRELVAELLDLAGAAGHRVRAVGLGVPEYVHDGAVTSAEVFAWDRQPADVLRDLPMLEGVPVVVEADVRCAALAEAVARGGDMGSMAYLSWGTGLSWTLVLGGRCHAGARGEALALGEWPVDPRSGLTWPGTLEEFASGRGMQARYADARGEWLDGAVIEARAAEGDEAATEVLASAAEAVGWAIAGLVQVVDPALVVLGGGVAAKSRFLPGRVAEVVPRVLARPRPPAVEVAVTGASAGLVGASLVAWAHVGVGS